MAHEGLDDGVGVAKEEDVSGLVEHQLGPLQDVGAEGIGGGLVHQQPGSDAGLEHPVGLGDRSLSSHQGLDLGASLLHRAPQGRQPQHQTIALQRKEASATPVTHGGVAEQGQLGAGRTDASVRPA